jgi:hypothetical protein
MKIRFRRNTIRYRLDQLDVSSLKVKGFCEERIDIPPTNMVFSLNIAEDDSKTILFDLSHLRLDVPSALMSPLIEGSQTGFECEIPGSGDPVLNILVERDFKCLVPRGEEDNNAFDNPLQDMATC